jgi:hypothetical protein
MGDASMLVYLFRDRGGSKTFAYSTDVTGRNIPRATAGTHWSFVSATLRQELSDLEEVMRHLRDGGFYVFKERAPAGGA